MSRLAKANTYKVTATVVLHFDATNVWPYKEVLSWENVTKSPFGFQKRVRGQECSFRETFSRKNERREYFNVNSRCRSTLILSNLTKFILFLSDFRYIEILSYFT